MTVQRKKKTKPLVVQLTKSELLIKIISPNLMNSSEKDYTVHKIGAFNEIYIPIVR